MNPQDEARLRELRKELAEVEAKIAELTPVPEVRINLNTEVLSMSDTKEWKDFVNTGVVENITSILDECYDSYIECIPEEFPNVKPKNLIGKFGSNKWLSFQLKTIKKLLDPSDMEDDFSDTAGGCDEVAWDAGLDVIREMLE
jgi:hypothetical protein